jgi:hypothetical protein
MGEGVCTRLCQDECPAGWTCQQVAGTDPDLVFVCVSGFTNLCRPCAAGSDCKSDVGAEDVCVSYGEAGSFCGGACAADGDCPWGFSCQDSVSVDGLATKQCVADAGVCPCTEKSVKLALWTSCQSSNEFGSCEGKRVCTADGLSPCDAPSPAEESCNGSDDDCDAFTDEPLEMGGKFIPLCDDDNPCTDDSCLGAQGCVNAALTGTECMDGDICTTADHCDDGLCIGSPVLCDDKDPCTDDACTAAGGCAYVDNSAPCDDDDPCTVADECDQGTCKGFKLQCDCMEDADCEALEDGDACNGTLFCDVEALPHQCETVPGSVVECEQPDGPESICVKAVCDPADGSCDTQPDHEGFACSLGDKCIVGQTCQAGACQGGMSLLCDDGSSCTEDACDPAVGCTHEPLAGPCSDGNVCTSGDACLDGECVAGAPLACADDNPCTKDACDPEVGCVHKPTISPDAECCVEPEDCPPGFSSPPKCEDQKSCQGQSSFAVCWENQCGSSLVQDDSACVGLAAACGLFKDIVCNGQAMQAPQACLTGCKSDSDCDPYAYCEGTCKATLANGQPCQTDNQCESGDCSPAPEALAWFCTPSMHECALEDGSGVHQGFAYCYKGDLWGCNAEDTWAKTECQQTCGYYVGVDGCEGAACTLCPTFCDDDSDCDPNAHCEDKCVADLADKAPCDEDSDCISGNCGAAPSGADFCIPLADLCAFDDGSGADAGAAVCLAGDRWTCTPAGTWAPTDCADACGLYPGVDSCLDGQCAVCPQSCKDDTGCDAGAYCGAGQCQPGPKPEDYKVVCWDAYPNDLGKWVSAFCPAGYTHYYHVCGGSGIDSYDYGPYYQDKQILHNNSGDHCWCCCNCNLICVKCKKG